MSKNIWKRDYAGRYTNRINGWVIEKSCDEGNWMVINPETGGVFDSFRLLRCAKHNYDNAA